MWKEAFPLGRHFGIKRFDECACRNFLRRKFVLCQNSKETFACFANLVEYCDFNENLGNSVLHFFQSRFTWLVN